MNSSDPLPPQLTPHLLGPSMGSLQDHDDQDVEEMEGEDGEEEEEDEEEEINVA